jgi:type VI secretion system secreted protein VgrG
MAELTQKNRALKIDTPLGEDKLLLQSFTGGEEISRLFRFQLDLISEDANIKPKSIVGKNVTLRVVHADSTTERYFNGYISRFSLLPSPVLARHASYQAEMVPWPWFLSLTADCRIFQHKSVPDIIKDVFGRFGFTDHSFELQGQHQARDYCVQYRETAFNFVTRLMEEEGMFFFFKHEKTKHTLVVADHKGVHQPCPFQDKINMEPTGGTGFTHDEDTIQHWERQYEYRTGKWAQTDYNFETPSTSLLSSVQTIIDLDQNKKYEVYDYPGEYLTKGEGDTLTKLRMEEEEVGYDIPNGKSDCRSMVSGHKFTLKRHPQRDQNSTYILTSVVHMAQQPFFDEGDGEMLYSNSFRCIPQEVTFRPPRRTPKPLVHGTQTALVVGPSGEEIYTDNHGRIKVQFYWDREGKKDDKSSCWIRVSQPWAGKGWGAVWLPRIGQEVVVDFLEGDPDRPIIIGRVYNAEQTVPYGLPSNQTQSGFKSRSSKGGGSDDFNEIRFEDKKGSEMFTVHAQKDLETMVENDETRQVDHDRTTTIKNDETKTVTQGNQKITLNQGNHSMQVKMGNMGTKIDLGKEDREAMQSIELKVGQSSVKLDQMGVTIKGMMIKIEGQIQVDIQGVMTSIKGTAMLTAQGGIVMIN